MTGNSENKVPTEEDWRSQSNIYIDEYYYEKFFGKTREDMMPYFIEFPLSASEALTQMPAIPFQYYVFNFIKMFDNEDYFNMLLQEGTASGAASTFLTLMRIKLTDEPKDIVPIYNELLRVAKYVSANQAKFEADIDIYDSFPERLEVIEQLYKKVSAEQEGK